MHDLPLEMLRVHMHAAQETVYAGTTFPVGDRKYNSRWRHAIIV